MLFHYLWAVCSFIDVLNCEINISEQCNCGSLTSTTTMAFSATGTSQLTQVNQIIWKLQIHHRATTRQTTSLELTMHQTNKSNKLSFKNLNHPHPVCYWYQLTVMFTVLTEKLTSYFCHVITDWVSICHKLLGQFIKFSKHKDHHRDDIKMTKQLNGSKLVKFY